MSNDLQKHLCSLKICDQDAIAPFFPRVRDRDDVTVLKCGKSGVIFLSRSDHLAKNHYENRSDLMYWGDDDRKAALLNTREDDQRRSEQFRKDIAGRSWLDIGTGLGGILDFLAPAAARVIAVEPQAGARECLQALGYQVYRNFEDIRERDIDIVTLFHVFEHFQEPLNALKTIKTLMKPGGKIVIEVPHARDILLSTFDNEAFKAFTFWSEHLILHTRQSLTVFLQAAGFQNILVEGFQRYPLANHFYWLAKGRPGGHSEWRHLKSTGLDSEYEKLLIRLDQTDTLIASARA